MKCVMWSNSSVATSIQGLESPHKYIGLSHDKCKILTYFFCDGISGEKTMKI